MTQSENFIVNSDTTWVQINEGMCRQVLGYDDQIMMIKIDFLKDGVGAVHSHVHRQCSYVVSGVFEFNIVGGKESCKVRRRTLYGTKCSSWSEMSGIRNPY